MEQGDNQIRRVERLTTQEANAAAAVTTAAHPLAAAVFAGARRPGERWRIILAKPLRLRAPLLLRASRKLDAAATRWEVPLLTVKNASRMEGEALLHLAGSDRVQIEASGLHESPLSSGPTNSSRLPLVPDGRRDEAKAGPWRMFRYGEGVVSMSLKGAIRSGERATTAVLADARLITIVALDGSLQAHFHFQVSHWAQRTLPVTLPAGARPLAAQVDDHWLPHLPSRITAAGETVLELPVPAHDGLAANEAAHRFEVVYSWPARATFPWQQVGSPPPALPVTPLQFRQTWRLPPGVRPLDEANYRRLPGPGEGRNFDDDLRGQLSARLPTTLTRSFSETPDDAGQLQVIADACQALRQGRAGHTLPLLDVLEQVRLRAGPEFRGFVLDSLALEEAGIGPETPVKLLPLASSQDQTPPWETLGLEVLPAGAAPLLTTRRQWEVWPAGASLSVGVPDAVELAVAEAAENGHDATGRFRLALEWLRGTGEAAVCGASGPLLPRCHRLLLIGRNGRRCLELILPRQRSSCAERLPRPPDCFSRDCSVVHSGFRGVARHGGDWCSCCSGWERRE